MNVQAFQAPAAQVEREFVGPLPQVAAKKRGRPAKYGSAAERQAAWRAANNVKTIRLDGKLAASIEKWADKCDVDQTHLINNLLRFALANIGISAYGIPNKSPMSDRRFSRGKRELVERDADLDSFSLA